MKTCFKCGKPKPIDEFYKHGMMADGYLNKCKECTKFDVRATRRSNVEYYRAYDRKRGSRQAPSYVRAYRERYPEKYAAHYAVGNAVRDGKLKKEPCFFCWSARAQAHHPDYSRPLDVVWLCPGCHHLLHAYENKVKEISNRSKDQHNEKETN